MIRMLFLLLVLFGYANHGKAYAETNSDIYKEAIAQLNQTTKDNAANTIVWFVRRVDQKSLTPLLDAIWRLDKKKIPELPWEEFKEAEVRLRFANLYAIWLRVNGMAGRGVQEINGDQRIEEIRDFVTKYRSSSDRNLRAHAITFTASSDSCDLKELVSIALEDDSILSTLAVDSIVKMRGRNARTILLNVQKKVKNEDVRGLIRRLLIEIENMQYPDAKYFKNNPKCPLR